MTYLFQNATAFNPHTGEGVPNATGQVFALSDVDFTTPLAVTVLSSGLQSTELTSDQYSQIPGFDAGDKVQVVFKSGEFTKILNTSTPLPGPVGPSAYEVAVENGYTGTEVEYNAALAEAPNLVVRAESAEQSAAASAGLVGAPAGSAVLAAISAGGAARNELNATIGDITGLTAVPGDAVTSTVAAANWAIIQAALDKGGRWRIPRTVGRIAINSALEMTVPGTELHHRNALLWQITNPEPVVNVDAPDCLINGPTMGQSGALNLTGMNAAAWEMSVTASKLTAINAYSNAHRLSVPYMKAEGFSSAMRVTNWDRATGAAAATLVDDVSIGDLYCKNVEFGIVAQGTRRLSYNRVVGSYCWPIGGFRPPHLIYFSGVGAENVEPQGNYALATWEGGASYGQAYQVKGVQGGNLGKMVARGCPGVLNLIDSAGVTLDIESTGDTNDSAYGSVSIDTTGTPVKDITFTRFEVKMVSNGIPYRAIVGTNIKFPTGMDVEVNHTTSGTAHDIEVRGDRCEIASLRYRNLGTASWRALGLFAGDGHSVGATAIRNARIGVEVRTTATNATFHQTPDITLHPTDGAAKMVVDAGAAPTLKMPDRPKASSLVVVRDNFTIANPFLTLSTPATGQEWVSRLGTWRADFATGIMRDDSSESQANLDIEAGIANADIRVSVKHKAFDGVKLRHLSPSEYLCVYLSDTQVVIAKRDPALTTLASATVAHQVGRWYDLRVLLFGDQIDVYVDGVWKVGHTLAAGTDAVKFAAQTRHGLFCSASAGGSQFKEYEARKI